MIFDGNTQQIQIIGNKLIIQNKNNLLGKLESLHSNEVVEIKISEITGAECKDASIFSNGYIKIYVNGKASMKTTVFFYPKKGIYQQALHFVNTLKSIMSQQKNNTFSVADELKKFKELLDMGVITPEEFEKKKRELLD